MHYSPNRCEFHIKHDHIEHIPGSAEDVNTHRLYDEVIESIDDQLCQGYKCHFNAITDDSATGQRRVTYEDIYNRMVKLKKELFEFRPNDMISVRVWLNEKLPRENYTIFNGTGYPIAYMFTNDHSAGPIQQWLIFLCDSYSFIIQQITIDYSILEVNAIQSVYPNTMIYYCAFYVL
ncbi:hypothetical protein BDA99DRAFT_544547 [Phascolomyces articulosus]|uniref:MULE transposase domain-containing protein n=1 Tax=Phascolomyces articulosus TaxID=60185 RepID=A0AAD5JK16_9FUNG|nr:hypothetical protein BDA99DRAFT_544547 [Phascolomyces articulosus]